MLLNFIDEEDIKIINTFSFDNDMNKKTIKLTNNSLQNLNNTTNFEKWHI